MLLTMNVQKSNHCPEKLLTPHRFHPYILQPEKKEEKGKNKLYGVSFLANTSSTLSGDRISVF